MNKHLAKVEAFMLRAEIEKPTSPTLPDKQRLLARLEWLREEVEELKQAIEADNLVGVADALADIEYINSGTILECGLDGIWHKVFGEVHISNMTKFPMVTREDGKLGKGPGYKAPNLKAVIFPQG